MHTLALRRLMDSKHPILVDLRDRVEKTVQHLKDHLAGIRTGRASPALVETIRVDYYGTPTPLLQMAHISVPEPRQLMIKPFDASPPVIKEIERAIFKSDLGLAPQSDGKVLRLILPPLSGEQRQKLAAKVKEITESDRVALRNERRDAKKACDLAKKDGELSEDEAKKLHDLIDQEIKAGEAKLDEILKAKTKEILEE
ncbi:MAG: ribosome recycling factor [Planctomycetota bacterium]